MWGIFLTSSLLSLVLDTCVIKSKCRLFNVGLGQAKMAVYISPKKKSEEDFTVEPVTVCVNMIKSSLILIFKRHLGIWTPLSSLEIHSFKLFIYLSIYLRI